MVMATEPPVIMRESALPTSRILDEIFWCGHAAAWSHEVLETTITSELTDILHGGRRPVGPNISVLNLITIDDGIWFTKILKELVRW